MFDVFARLVARLDPAMMLGALSVGLAAALCLFRLRSRMRDSRGMVHTAWIFLCGTVTGVGGWGAELTALAAYHPGPSVGFDPWGMLGSLIVGVLGATGALALAWMGRDRLRVVTGGLILAMSGAGVHFVALAACRMSARETWEPILVWFAVVLASAGYVGALLSAGAAKRFLHQALGAAGLLLGGVALFLVSLAGLHVTPDAAVAMPNGLISGPVVAFIGLTLAILTTLGGLGAAYIDDASSRSAVARTRRLADAAREGIVVLGDDDSTILDCNAAFSDMAGAPVEDLVGARLMGMLSLVEGGVLEYGRAVEAALRCVDGASMPVEVHARPLHERGEERPSTVVAVRDMREQRAAADHIRFLAEHDPLTGLANRALMNRTISARLGEGVILAIVRVVNNAETNSLYGHAVGDAVLTEMAERLKRAAAGALPGYTCMPARLGGAEMAFVAFGEARADAASAFSALTRNLRRPIAVDSQIVEPQICVGVSHAPGDAQTADEMVRHAEVALESAARENSEGVVYFRQDLQDQVVAQRTLLRDLKVGIASDQLVIYYQPQAHTHDGRLCGFEALVRWIHPERGFMAPDSFIPAAEQSGLIIELGEQVLRRACAEAMTWPHPTPVAVNLSPLQVGQTDLPRLVHQILLESGLPPHRLELEITESALFRDYQRALDTLRRLKALGVGISMDDFGTGFSSLSTLQSFPFDKIKIDKSFVNGVGTLERSTVIVKAVLGIGKGLAIPVVAEGVETAEQMAFLRDEGCAVVQGYHIGKPARIETHQNMFDALSASRAPSSAAAATIDKRAGKRAVAA